MKSTGTVQLLEQLQQWQFPAILTDASGKVLEENITNFDLKITDQLRELLVRYQPGSVFNWGERGMRVLPGPGCSAGERLFLIVPPEQAQMEQLQSELDDYTDKVEKMHYLQEMLETRGAELNIAHQRLLDNSRKLEQTGKELKERQSQMQNNFDIARRIVEELFPFPAVRHGDITVFGRTHVANNLSGDFFEIISQRPDELTVILADVSGHGLPSAMILMMTRLLLNTFSSSTMMPRDLLLLTHGELYDNIPRGNFIAFGVLNINRNNNMIRYSIGGLYAALVVRPDAPGLLELPTNNFSLAFKEECEFEDELFQLLPGDKVVLFTDGLPETVNGQGEYFDLPRIHHILEEERHLTGHSLRRRLFAEQNRFIGGAPIQDDTSIMVIEMDIEPLFESTITDSSAELSEVMAQLTPTINWQLNDPELVNRLNEVLEQAVRNGVESCERNQLPVVVKLQLFRRHRQLKIRVTDNGPGYQRPAGSDEDSDHLVVAGAVTRGFRVFSEILDEIYLNEEGNEFNLVKYLEEDDYGD